MVDCVMSELWGLWLWFLCYVMYILVCVYIYKRYIHHVIVIIIFCENFCLEKVQSLITGIHHFFLPLFLKLLIGLRYVNVGKREGGGESEETKVLYVICNTCGRKNQLQRIARALFTLSLYLSSRSSFSSHPLFPFFSN